MITAGADVGTRFLKTALVEGSSLLAWSVTEMRGNFREAYDDSLRESLKMAGVRKGAVKKIIATGYGGHLVRKAAYTISDAACIARGAHFMDGRIRTVIDAGGLFIKVITIDETGFLEQNYVNERCAAGSGRFLEMIAESLDIPFGSLSEKARASRDPYIAGTGCAVFAESDIITQVNRGRESADIIAGVMDSIAAKTMTIMKSAAAQGPLTVSGGLAGVDYFRDRLRENIDLEFLECRIDPQVLPAYGAAILAQGAELNRRA